MTSIRSREIGQRVWIDLEAQVAGDLAVCESVRIKADIKKKTKQALERPATVVVYLSCQPG